MSAVLLSGTACAADPIVAPSGEPNRTLDSYVLFALDELSFKGGDITGVKGYVLGGDVGVNNPGPPPGAADANINVGANKRFYMSDGTQLVGDYIRLGSDASVYDVYGNYAVGAYDGEVRNSNFTFTPPIISGVSNSSQLATYLGCEKGDFTASTNPDDDRTVVDRPSRVDPPVKILTGSYLPPGTYRDLQVQDGTTLHLGAGTYTFRRFNTGQNVNVYTVPGTIIQIEGDPANDPDFNLGGNGAYFGSEIEGEESVACICLLGEKVQFSDNGEFWGVIKAPYANINLGRGFTHYGRFIGNTISSDFNDNVTAKDCTLDSVTTTLEVSKTATGYCGKTYNWTIDKTVTPEDWIIEEGDTVTSEYTIEVTKSESAINCTHVEGNITVTNKGDYPTEGLAIEDEIYDDTTLMGSATVDVSPMPVLAPGESYDYHYRVDFDDPCLNDTITTFTNKATVSIANGDSVEASADFNLTEPAPECPNDDTIHVEDSNIADGEEGSQTNPWEFNVSSILTYFKSFTWDDLGANLNTATIQETGQSDTAAVNVEQIPEFPTIALPMLAVIGLSFVCMRRKE